jgi:hypothetical protein
MAASVVGTACVAIRAINIHIHTLILHVSTSYYTKQVHSNEPFTSVKFINAIQFKIFYNYIYFITIHI